jgi:glycosyltransferase involved in cell wall biosynthesis
MAPPISIVIPTYKRPSDLERLLNSIHADIGERDDVILIVADNDKNGSAKGIIDTFTTQTGRKVDYAIEPEPGVSNARNNAMARVRSRFVLFLDDDMEVVPPYLDPIMDSAKTLGTAITFAPAIAKLPKGVEAWEPWLAPLFSRVFDGPTRQVTETLGTGGCLIDLEGLKLPTPVFDPALNEVGGEDDAFFAHIMAQGGTVGWCAETKAWEHVPPHRATPSYVWSRHFAFGQTPSRDAADQNALRVVKWMGVGAVQALVHAPLYAIKRLFRRPSSIGHLGRMAQGVGKVLWWDGLSPRLYGRKAR